MYSVLIPISATLGDFIESYYKRKAMAKDSGNLIPGHGGMLDRMDSFLISISVISLIIIIGTWKFTKKEDQLLLINLFYYLL